MSWQRWPTSTWLMLRWAAGKAKNDGWVMGDRCDSRLAVRHLLVLSVMGEKKKQVAGLLNTRGGCISQERTTTYL